MNLMYLVMNLNTPKQLYFRYFLDRLLCIIRDILQSTTRGTRYNVLLFNSITKNGRNSISSMSSTLGISLSPLKRYHGFR